MQFSYGHCHSLGCWTSASHLGGSGSNLGHSAALESIISAGIYTSAGRFIECKRQNLVGCLTPCLRFTVHCPLLSLQAGGVSSGTDVLVMLQKVTIVKQSFITYIPLGFLKWVCMMELHKHAQ
jgi:hypothetical protein